MLRKLFTLCVITIIFITTLSTDTSAFLFKHTGSRYTTLHLKELVTDTTIDHYFASTYMRMCFHNSNGRQVKTYFFFNLPENAIITQFSYWYGGNKVIARVVEKKRAADIYRANVLNTHNPVLVEKIEASTFRVRIFPVLPSIDLKFELKYAETLKSDRNGIIYRLPLFVSGLDKNLIDNLNVKIRVKADMNIQSVATNYGLLIDNASDVTRIAFKGEKYHPKRDMIIRQITRNASVRVALRSGLSNTKNGYFTLSLATNKRISDPEIKILGIKTYDICHTVEYGFGKQQVLYVFGRYNNGGKATVLLQNRRFKYAENVLLKSTCDSENLAGRLWAAQRMEQLSVSSSNRSAILKLGLRYNIPCRYTSLLGMQK